MPTRASLFTGRYPHIHGVWANGVPLSSAEVTMPQVLSEAGYATCASGKIHFEPQQPYGHSADAAADVRSHSGSAKGWRVPALSAVGIQAKQPPVIGSDQHLRDAVAVEVGI